MHDVLNALGKDLVLQAFTVMFTVVYVSLSFLYITRIKRRRLERDLQLQRAVSTGLTNSQIETVDDLVNIYRGVTNAADDDVSYKAAVSRVLRRILVGLAADPEGAHDKRQLKLRVKQLLNQIEVETPFADLPAAERNLIIDAKRFIAGNELQAATQKVEDIASLIEARQEAYEKLQAANKWSVPLAIVGLVLTIVFGVASLLP